MALVINFGDLKFVQESAICLIRSSIKNDHDGENNQFEDDIMQCF